MMRYRKGGIYNKNDWANFLDKASQRHNSILKTGGHEDYQNNIINFMQKYAEDNEEELNYALKYYKHAITGTFFANNYILLNEKYIQHLLADCKVMIITANSIEKAVLHHKIVESGSVILTRLLCDNIAYYVFKWGKYWIAHIHQSQTGAGKDMGTIFTIDKALKLFTPNVIISLGVAFGIDYETQNIGDVLVSRRILPYSDNKRDEDYIKPDRTQDKTIDDWLCARLENVNGFLENVTYGDMLSGSSIMSSCDEKDRVCLGYTKSDFIVGGEMEGNAVFQFSKWRDIPGVVIKAICDWGVAKNGIKATADEDEKLKNSLQAFAMMQVVEKCAQLFNDKELFSMPKRKNYEKLSYKYRVCFWGLITSQIIMVTYGLCKMLFYFKNINVKNVRILVDADKFFELPFIWFAIPTIFIIKFFPIFFLHINHKIIWKIRFGLKKKFFHRRKR